MPVYGLSIISSAAAFEETEFNSWKMLVVKESRNQTNTPTAKIMVILSRHVQ